MKVTVPPATVVGLVIDKVFTSAFVEVKVQVETPDAFEEVQALYAFLEPVSVAEN